jgi:ABC-type transport system involved in multi-copper enzyme maturation permease subunit
MRAPKSDPGATNVLRTTEEARSLSVDLNAPILIGRSEAESRNIEVIEHKTDLRKLLIEGESALRKLLIDNPMHMETLRFRRRFLNVTLSPKLNLVLVGIVGLIYLMIVGLVFALRADLPVGGVLIVQQSLTLLAATVAAHATIAGERDRRSWDLLRVAPVTQYQIVVGKFRGVAALVLGLQAAFLPLVLIGQYLGRSNSGVLQTILIEVLCFASSSFCAAATISLSARLKSANATLVASIASMVGIYAVFPLLAMVFANAGGFDGRWLNDLLALYHPLFLLGAMLSPEAFGNISVPLAATVSILAYLVLNIFFLYQTGRRLTRLRRAE